ncbi:hypothetical protein [Streptomyces hawaiiensis]|uniref:hypothetical protein n=1 Tax=Streptomyces hawaiiensis TaxID=67305 RepID=UPI003655241A
MRGGERGPLGATEHHRQRNLIRIRSALAVVALTAALSATGAATASANDDGPGYRNDHHVACSPYSAEIEWGGADCRNGPFDI